jgi:dipeptidyl aminopeptidase/acylaminoacyl peptidase
VARSHDDNKWIAAYMLSDGPIKYYLYDRTAKKAEFLFVSNAKQIGLPLAKMHSKIIKSRDGLDLVSYLTVPRWLDNGAGLPQHPLPLVLYVHGGPTARDSWGFDRTAQLLANRGLAVLQVNYRGSTGFGKDFANAGYGEWSGKMQRDLEDAVQWCVENNIADKDKVVIMGGSYGGYATLVGMTMTPDLYAAGIDIVGPSNLETLVSSVPPYWKPAMAHLKKRLGVEDFDTPEAKEHLKKISPLTYAHQLKRPLLVVQGANDPRVKKAEADQIVQALKEKNIPVMYLLYPDEGHGLARPENSLSMYAYIETFLSNVLGTRCLPHDGNFPGATVQILEGHDLEWVR